MNLFIKKIVQFIFLIIASLVLLTIANRLVFNYFNPFAINKECNMLILGDSHSKYAFDDQIIEGTYNLSNSADSYFYSYNKLKHAIKLNPHIDTVLISFSTHNIHECIENRWLLNNSHLNERLRVYFPLLDMEDFVFLLRNKPVKILSGIFGQILFPVLYLSKGKKILGSYENLHYNILAQELEKLEINEWEEFASYKESDIEKEYLQKMIYYCRASNVEVILVNPPLHKSIKDMQDNLYQFYNKHFSDILFYDFSQIEMKEEYFGDLVHLNPSGANYLSKRINDENLFAADVARAHNIVYE